MHVVQISRTQWVNPAGIALVEDTGTRYLVTLIGGDPTKDAIEVEERYTYGFMEAMGGLPWPTLP